MEEVYTPAEIAEMFRVVRETVYNWIYTGKIKAVKLPGGQWRIPKSEVERLLKSRN